MMRASAHTPREPPETIKSDFYRVVETGGGLCDVYLAPRYNDLRVVRGATVYDGLEADIRARYDDWCRSAESLDALIEQWVKNAQIVDKLPAEWYDPEEDAAWEAMANNEKGAVTMGLRAHFLNQGRVDAILIECDGEYMFVDGGYRRNGLNAVKYMRKMGVTHLRYYVATHGHKNHIAAAAAIIGAIQTDEIIVGRQAVYEAIIKYAQTPAELKAIRKAYKNVLTCGSLAMLGEARVWCLGPHKQRDVSCGSYAENYNSLILRVVYGGEPKLLLTGDSTAAIIAKCGASAKAAVLKNPHHAGRQPMSLLNQVDPTRVIVCSNVRAGAAYRKRLKIAGATLYNTCEGTVVAEM